MAARGLTPKQQRFVEEYLHDLNGAAAYRRAGYKVSSDNAAAANAARLIANDKVAAAIAAGKAARSQRTEISADQVVRELARIAFSDMRCFARWGPSGVSLLSSENLPDDAAACVAEVSQTTSLGGGSIRFKLHSKPTALKLLGEHLGVFKERDPLEALLAVLPPDVARGLREALGRHVPPGGSA